MLWREDENERDTVTTENKLYLSRCISNVRINYLKILIYINLFFFIVQSIEQSVKFFLTKKYLVVYT